VNIKEFRAKVHSAQAVPKVMEFLGQWDFEGGAADVRIEAASDTLSYKAVFWIWMRHFAKEFNETPDNMHLIMCNRFLGWTKPQTIGKTVIKPTLITWTHPRQLTASESGVFLSKIEEWGVSVGHPVPRIEDSEYMKYVEAS